MPNHSAWREIYPAGCTVDLLALYMTTLHCIVSEALFSILCFLAIWSPESVEPLAEICALQFYLLGATQVNFPSYSRVP